MSRKVIFVSYTGEFPNLCSGILILDVDGKEYRFGHDYARYSSKETKDNYHSILVSGGCCYFENGYEDAYVAEGEWEIDEEFLPDELKPYADEIKDVVNENIPYGCCGGCL